LNFYAAMPYRRVTYRPALQTLPGTAAWPRRTNLLHDVFFVARHNQELVGIGYFVRTNDSRTGALGLSPFGVGTLYRFETNAPALSGRTVANMQGEFNQAKLSEFRATKVVDGVVHFLTRAFDTNGYRIVANLGTNISAYYDQFDGREQLVAGEIEVYEFFSNAVPATVELELGILEDRAWQQFKAQPTATAKSNHLAGLAGRVHVFRQRIPIRNVDPGAYQ
jgi:hypothetical protein